MKLKHLFALLLPVLAFSSLSIATSAPNSFGFAANPVEAAETNANTTPIIIDGYEVKNPEKLYIVEFTTQFDTHVTNAGILAINTSKSISVEFDERFANLTSIYFYDLIPERKDWEKKIDIYISSTAPNLREVQCLYHTPLKSNKCYNADVYIDLHNKVMDTVIVSMNGGLMNSVKTHLSNFSIDYTLNGGAIFDGFVTLENATILNYNDFVLGIPSSAPIYGPMPDEGYFIESGYYDIKPDARISNVNVKYCGRGGYYTQRFKDFVALHSPNFVDPNYKWHPTGLDDFPWEITDIDAVTIDGVPINHPENITTVALITNDVSHLSVDGITFYLNVSEGKKVEFNIEFYSLVTISCTDLFCASGEVIESDIYVDITISTPSIEKVSFNIYTPKLVGEITAGLYLNLFLFNNPLKSINCGYANDGSKFVHTLLNDFSTINSTQTEGYNTSYVFGDLVELNNCIIKKYNGLTLHGTSKINSGYFDIDNNGETHLDGQHVARGGYYTEAFHKYVIDIEKKHSIEFVEEGYQFYPTTYEDYDWVVDSQLPPLSPSVDEIKARIDEFTTMRDLTLNDFMLSIAYSYNYPGQENKFQIQIAFNFKSIYDYYMEVAELWGKDGFNENDSLTIEFKSNRGNTLKYDLLNDDVWLIEYPGTETLIDSDPNLPAPQYMPGYKIFTIDLGDLMGPDSDNVNGKIRPTLYFNLSTPTGRTEEGCFYFSSLHEENDKQYSIVYSFQFLLNKYLSLPALAHNESLLRCKRDLGL